MAVLAGFFYLYLWVFFTFVFFNFNLIDYFPQEQIELTNLICLFLNILPLVNICIFINERKDSMWHKVSGKGWSTIKLKNDFAGWIISMPS